ncbi:hypothetical protein RvY_09954-2 [Ramazzottius varieornatus]|uniref:Uncharacterized protein n=1 Tax=Ramazzottius varieornatus TaxID=947166 RepID=A0A1D1VB51_RAMVA|nr:hypothetical protein RvY_09954-2 [Ramazzottius varieornatus]
MKVVQHSAAYSALVMCAAQSQRTFEPAAQCSNSRSSKCANHPDVSCNSSLILISSVFRLHVPENALYHRHRSETRVFQDRPNEMPSFL